MILTLTLVTIVGLLLLGTPLIIAMASGVAVYATLGGSWMLQYPQQVTDGMSSFVLLAMPLRSLNSTLGSSDMVITAPG